MKVYSVNQEIRQFDENGELNIKQEREVLFKELTESEYYQIVQFGACIFQKSTEFDPILGEYVEFESPKPVSKISRQILWTEEEENIILKFLSKQNATIVQKYREEFPDSSRSDAAIVRKISRLRTAVANGSKQEIIPEPDQNSGPKIGEQIKIIDPEVNRIFKKITKGEDHKEDYPKVLKIYDDTAIIGYSDSSIRIHTSQEKIAPVKN